MNETPSATAILAPIWRRKWLILIVGIVVAVGTYLYYKHKPLTFQSETQLYLSAGSEQQAGEKGAAGKNSGLSASAQPTIINSVVTEEARHQLKAQHNHTAKVAAKGKIKAKANEKSQFVNVTTQARTPRASALLANTVASIYIRRQHTQYERGILNQLTIAHRQLKRIETPILATKGSKTTDTAASQGNVIREAQLQSRINQLEAQLQIKDVEQLKPAKPRAAQLLGPAPKKNAEFGFVIGLLLAGVAAFALGRLDRRLRLLGDIEAVFPTQLLTVLPTVRRPVVDRGGYPSPSRLLLEPMRRLQATLLLADGAPKTNGSSNPAPTESPAPVGTLPPRMVPRTLLFLSAEAGDGRSTVVADLALVQREAGERVAIVEADFRRPSQARVLGVPGTAGLPEVLAGALTLGEALQVVPAPQPEPLAAQPRGGFETATMLASREQGAVALLPSRAAAVNPPALLGSAEMHELLHALAQEYDRVLVDVPSPLEVSDAMPLLAAVDAIVLVARAGHTHERSARRLWQLVSHTPSAPILGVVANGITPREMQKYGISSGNGERRGWKARLIGR
jgi:Mrp family chromosome partitioning ATPase/capsular polysaccharide biosynthesis protein